MNATSLRTADSRLLLLLLCASLLLGSYAGLCAHAAADPRVSDTGRFLVHADGKPFFYLGDTAWELFHRLNRVEAVRYLDDRAAKGFTVIQAVALAELDGLHTPNALGHKPLVGDNPEKPDVKDGPDNDYWDHVDFIVREANQRGLFLGLLPTWGDKWTSKQKGAGPAIFNSRNATAYGRWLGARYREAKLIWILGGDRVIQDDSERAIIRAMAQGLREGDGGAHLITFHPRGGEGSAQYFHNEPWLDFNMRQNGHADFFNGRYEETREDYARKPVKPVLDGEPIYEGHPVNFKAADHGHSLAADVRRPFYWDTFGGACGHTYGHHSIWQMFDPMRGQPVNNPLMPWQAALAEPGVSQMQHGKNLLLSRPYLTRIPDDSVIVESAVKTSVPGAGRYRFVATRDSQGSYAMVYAPVGRAFKVRLSKVTGPRVKAWWFNPRDGKATPAGEFSNAGEREFTPPDRGEALDWVLVLDDASRNFPAPGQVGVAP